MYGLHFLTLVQINCKLLFQWTDSITLPPPTLVIYHSPFSSHQEEGGECDSNPEDVDDLRPVDVVSSVPSVHCPPPPPYLAPPPAISVLLPGVATLQVAENCQKCSAMGSAD